MAKKIETRWKADWVAANPVLKLDQPGIERNTNRIKIGDGVTAWNDLPYVTSGTISGNPAGVQQIVHGTNASVSRPDAPLVVWVGTVRPTNAGPADLVFLDSV